MFEGKSHIIIVLLIVVIASFPVFADWKDDAKAVKISGGEHHTLILTADDFVWGCGLNTSNQLGIGNTTSQFLPVKVLEGDMDTTLGFLEDINDIASGWKHSLACDKTDGIVWAWGSNGDGQLGIGNRILKETPVRVSGVAMGTTYLQDIIAISAGRSGTHSLAVANDNIAYAWGNNDDGQIGNDDQGTDALAPVKVDGGAMETEFLEDIISVSAGAYHSMALDLDGYVWTWGDDAYGQLGIDGTGDKDTPVQVLSGEQGAQTYLENIDAISAGWDHCMALDSQKNVYTWGRNTASGYSDGGRLGDGTKISRDEPVIVLSGEQDPGSLTTPLEGIIAISAGEGHSLALDENGDVWAWGRVETVTD